MATYAIGDIQGCYKQFCQLLDKLQFNPKQDKLWLTGDLVNRGPDSLEVLRFVYKIRDSVITVLGNHDLHLLAMYYGNTKHSQKSTLQAILQANDKDQLINWLRHQPLLHYDKTLNYVLIHAGLPAQWNLSTAQNCAQELQTLLQGKKHKEFLRDHLYGNQPDLWSEQLKDWDRFRFISNCFTRLRYCNAEGRLLLKHKDSPQNTQDNDVYPWFLAPKREKIKAKIIFGHWSTLGYYTNHQVISLDSGCLWGKQLTAQCLETGQVTQLDCPQIQSPKKFV